MSDWHGIERRYRSGDHVATRLRELVPQSPGGSARTSGARTDRPLAWIDRDGVLAAWGERDDPTATIVAGVRRVVMSDLDGPRATLASNHGSDGGWAAVLHGDPAAGDRDIDARLAHGQRDVEVDATAPGSKSGDVAGLLGRDPGSKWVDGAAWTRAFESAVARIARRARAPVVAIGGGLDGAAVLAAWRASGVAMPTVVTAVTGFDGYDEVDAATAIAARYGCRCDRVDVTPQSIVRAIPEAAAVGETPLYNLHPVARLVLAREVASRGHDVLVTGDGGDAVFVGVPDHDYVPIVAAYTRAYLAHASPYRDDAVIAATPIDPMRRVLRDYIGDERPKRARMMPALALDAVADRGHIDWLGRSIDLAPAVDVRWVTLDHAVRELER